MPWLYTYEYPLDCLQLRFIVPSLPSNTGSVPPPTTASVASAISLPNSGMIPFQVALSEDANGNPSNVILTNQSQAQAVYTANQPDPLFWDSMFQQAMVAALAAFLVPAINFNAQMMQMQVQMAEALIDKARAADGRETWVTQDHLPDFIIARAGSAGGLGWSNGYPSSFSPWLGNGLYADISWPTIG